MMKEIGVSMVRSDINWPWLKKDKDGKFDFHDLDRKIEWLRRSEIGFLPILNQAPSEALPFHEHQDEWADFVHQTVSHYRKTIPYWEVLNEHNFPGPKYWGSKDEHTKHYTKLLEKSYETIKAVDPTQQVVYGGTSGIPLDYIESTLQYGAGKYFDIMNVHPYSWSNNPEYLIGQFRRLNRLLEKYGLQDKPVWATEIGWSTAPQKRPVIYKQILPIAFQAIGIDPKKVPIVFLDEVNNENYDFKSNFPEFKEWVQLPSACLKDLDPERYPVLLPVREEYFAPYYAEDLLRYVKRGGTIILPQGVPFTIPTTSYDNDYEPLPKPETDLKKELHMGLEYTWTHGYPKTERIEIPGIPDKDLRHFQNIRFLSDKKLKGNDRFIPLAYGIKDDFKKPFAGIYRYDSDLKGNVIAIVEREDVIRARTTEDVQAQILPRAHLLMFAEGIKKVFWYSFLSGNPESSNVECNFGIVSAKRIPKPAYYAYGTLTKMYPPGSTVPHITVRPDGIYIAKWQRPDGKNIMAVWIPETRKECRLEIPGEILETIDYLGNPVKVNPDKITVSPGILYFVSRGNLKSF